MKSNVLAYDRVKRSALTIALILSPFLQQAVAEDADSAFAFFDERCLRNGPDFDGAEQAARAAGWMVLPAQALKALTPFADASDAEGWIVSAEGEALRVLVVSKGSTGTENLQGCTVGLYGIDAGRLEKSISSRLGFSPQGKEQDSELSYDKWLRDDLSTLITLTHPLTSQISGSAVASVISARVSR